MPLVHGHFPTVNSEWLLDGSPAGMFRKNMPRVQAAGNLAALTTQVMTSAAIFFEAGELVTSLTFLSGATAAGTPTNWWFALYDASTTPALLAQSADQLTAAWAADTAKTLALATPQSVPTTGVYYAAVMVKATTVPTLIGASGHADSSAAVVTGQKVLARTSGASLTTTAPATIATPTTVGTVPLVIATQVATSQAQVSVGTSAARLDAGGDGTVTAQNVGAVDVSLGNASVTTSDGFKLVPGASYSADLRTSAPGGPSTSAWTGDTLYGVVASGTCVVHVIRHGV